uniref:Uncharacterized protein n=1 Tax=Siphoviridae sp. ctmpG14 TaxID=2825654 RepID=A0A8S5PCQ1_9CAUD|nr:MAG TPA: hypothetical protein [Siphoviridae sp. ctmpG14]
MFRNSVLQSGQFFYNSAPKFKKSVFNLFELHQRRELKPFSF